MAPMGKIKQFLKRS